MALLTIICPVLIIVNALLVLPAVILNPVGLPVVARGSPTINPLFGFSTIFLVWLLIVMVFSKILITLITIVAVLALAPILVILIVRL